MSLDKPTSFDIAALAGVSQPTVSRALRGDRTVSEATRLRIEAIARQLNYTVDKNASSLRRGQSNTLALLFFEDPTPDDSLINPFFLSMMGSITRTCALRGYDLLTSFQQLSNDWHVDYEDSRKADGIILLGYGDYEDYRARLDQLNAQGTHFVRWGSVRQGPAGATIGCDNVLGGHLAVEHLIAQGRHRIAFLGEASSHYPEFEDRYRGACDAMREAGLAPDPLLQVDAITTEASGYDAMTKILEGGTAFDAVFAASDMIAIGATRALEKAGRQIPHDVAVVGFDDLPAASLAHPPLTTVAQDYRRAGELLVDTLLARIRGRPTEAVILPPRLMIRGVDRRRLTEAIRVAHPRARETIPILGGTMNERPRQSFAGLWNISFGFFGIQIGFALQNANMSRVFQTLGSSLDDLPALWVAAPLTGLLVQPIIGHMSDRTWLGRLGRRRPYFLTGAILATLALFAMPLAPALLFAAVLLWVLDASLNISMEPFRAFVGDMLRKDQHSAGYAVQTAFIGAGAVVGSIFPKLLEYWGVANTAAPGHMPDTVKIAFWFGGAALFASVLWTVLTTREYSPDEIAAFDGEHEAEAGDTIRLLAARSFASSAVWIAAGAVIVAAVAHFALKKEVYLLGGLLVAYGVASIVAIARARQGSAPSLLGHIVGDFSGMPDLMKRLALVQFFSWSALFIMWINTTPVVAQYAFGAADPASARYQEGANWVDLLFGAYNGVAAIAALTLLPWLSARIGKAKTHVVGLLCGAAGYASFFVIRDPKMLLVSEVGIGIAWASILAMPYAILASSLPQRKLGVYMGLFNVFVVIPQLLVATVMGSIMKAWFPTEPIYTMAFAAAVMVLAAGAMLRVEAD